MFSWFGTILIDKHEEPILLKHKINLPINKHVTSC